MLGHEYAGEVIDIGKGVEGIKKGDTVAVMPTHGCGHCGPCLMGEPSWCEKFKLDGGGYAQFSVAETHQCIRLPKTVSMDDGALVEPLAVSLRAANLANIKAGSRVLVIGAGPIGLGVIFWARHLGAGKIAVTNLDRLPEPLARTMGADEFITVSENQNEDINHALGGAPDIVFECVGAPGLIIQAIEQVRPRGTVVLVGLCTVPEPINPFQLIQKSAVIQPSAFYGVKEFEVAIDTLDAGHVEPHAMITETVDSGRHASRLRRPAPSHKPVQDPGRSLGELDRHSHCEDRSAFAMTLTPHNRRSRCASRPGSREHEDRSARRRSGRNSPRRARSPRPDRGGWRK